MKRHTDGGSGREGGRWDGDIERLSELNCQGVNRCNGHYRQTKPAPRALSPVRCFSGSIRGNRSVQADLVEGEHFTVDGRMVDANADTVPADSLYQRSSDSPSN